jgi:peptidoglycan/xylan/chitin deacetylase (PgdA/CDA1 family)
MEQRAIEAVTVLLNSYRLPSGTDKDMLLRTYLMAVDDVATEAICLAAKRFIRGEVDGHDKRFAPSTGEFASEARKRQAQIDYEARPKIEAPEAKPERFVPRHWITAWFDWMGGRMSAKEFTEITGKRVE